MKGNNITIENCDISFSKHGISLNYTEESYILNCTFYQHGRGILVDNCSNISIKSCVMSRCGIGSFIHRSSDIDIQKSTFMTNGLSIYSLKSTKLLFDRVYVQDNSDNHGGIFCQESSIIQINYSYIIHNGIGINIDRSDHITISICKINNNTHFGILLRPDSHQISIINNLIRDNFRFGIYCYKDTSSIIMENKFIDNYLFGLYSKESVYILDENWWGSTLGPSISSLQSRERVSLNNFIFHFGHWNISSFPIHFKEIIPKYQYQQYNSTNATIHLEGVDSDGDGVPNWWEEKWGYSSDIKDNHHYIDDDGDGLSNVEECFTDQWGSNPTKKDIFLEIDWIKSDNPMRSNKPSSFLLDKITQSFEKHDISLHIDDGCFGEGGEIPKRFTSDFSSMIDIYWDFFLNKKILNPRKGIFHYAIISDECADVSYPFIGWDSFDGIAISSEKAKKISPQHPAQMIIAGGIMHQLGSTLGLTVETHQGNDNLRAGTIGSIEWIKYHQYRSSMNYLFKYRILSYSDGTRGPYDFDDWSHLDLTYFKETIFQ
jgi:parallel beta-helix repeat protein